VINRNHDNRARRTLDELPGIFIHIAPLQPTPYILLGILMYVRGATRPTLWPLMRSSIIIIHLHPFSNINNNIINPISLQCMHRTAINGMRIALPTHMCIHIHTYICRCMYMLPVYRRSPDQARTRHLFTCTTLGGIYAKTNVRRRHSMASSMEQA
jgi:hypothetical protein